MQSSIFRWYGQLHEGQEDVQDNPRSGCHSGVVLNGQ